MSIDVNDWLDLVILSLLTDEHKSEKELWNEIGRLGQRRIIEGAYAFGEIHDRVQKLHVSGYLDRNLRADDGQVRYVYQSKIELLELCNSFVKEFVIKGNSPSFARSMKEPGAIDKLKSQVRKLLFHETKKWKSPLELLITLDREEPVQFLSYVNRWSDLI